MFQGCLRLHTINMPSLKKVALSMFYGCGDLNHVKLDQAVSIEKNGFMTCAAMEKLDTVMVTSIDSSAFSYSSSLTALILRSAVVCELKNVNAFANTPIAAGTGYIYVPAALVAEYQAAANWNTFAAQFRAIEDYPEICDSEN